VGKKGFYRLEFRLSRNILLAREAAGPVKSKSGAFRGR
jgi:hypothetical protein